MAAREDSVLNVIAELYDDAPRCAEIAGLHYVQAGERGIRRRRHGKGFAYRDARSHRLNGKVRRPHRTPGDTTGMEQRGHIRPSGERVLMIAV